MLLVQTPFVLGCSAPPKAIGITIANAEVVEIYYKNNCSSCYQDAIVMATEHCEKYSRNPIPAKKTYLTVDGIGRTVTTFICK